MEEPKYLRLPLTGIINLLQEKHYTNPIIAKKIGVTSLQVHYYHRGKTKVPSPLICMSIFEEFEHNGLKLLVDVYKTYEELEAHYKLVKESNVKDKQSTRPK